MSGRKIRSVALPRYKSSIGGLPTIVVAYTASRRMDIPVMWNVG